MYDNYETTDSRGRWNYYSCRGTPTLWFDGAKDGYGLYEESRREFDKRKILQPAVTITLKGNYTASTGQGTAIADIKNISGSRLSGKCHFVICQKKRLHDWQGDSVLHHITRKMLPDYKGTTLSIASNETETISQDISVKQDWNRDSCYLTVFVQKDDKEIDQAVEIDLVLLGQTSVYPGTGKQTQNIPAQQLFSLKSNIVTEQLRITLSDRSRSRIQIIDCAGSLSASVFTDRTEISVPIEHLGAGCYFCIVVTRNQMSKQRFIKY